MKEDYIWDKTGNDPEIERLENLLSAYKYAETEPPVIPVKAIEIERRWFWNLRFAFPTFAAAAAMLVVLGVWFSSPPRQNTAGMQVIEEEASAPIRTNDAVPNAILLAEKIVPARQAIKRITRTMRLTSVKPTRKEPILTAEEKFAYGQLMLALSITGEKLKVVRDTVNNVENSSEMERLDK